MAYGTARRRFLLFEVYGIYYSRVTKYTKFIWDMISKVYDTLPHTRVYHGATQVLPEQQDFKFTKKKVGEHF